MRLSAQRGFLHPEPRARKTSGSGFGLGFRLQGLGIRVALKTFKTSLNSCNNK